MPDIHAIYHYPVKGLSPELLLRVELTPGETIPGDRLYAIPQSDYRLSGPWRCTPQSQRRRNQAASQQCPRSSHRTRNGITGQKNFGAGFSPAKAYCPFYFEQRRQPGVRFFNLNEPIGVRLSVICWEYGQFIAMIVFRCPLYPRNFAI
jgi:hypothetical protein